MDSRNQETRGLRVLSAIVGSHVALLAQDASCNNLTRSIAQAAGIYGLAEQTCSQLTISVAGQSFSSPAKCLIGYSQYLGTVYTCGPAATGLHCNPRGFQVPIDNYTGGACPDLTGLNPGSWGSWDEVPAAIAKAMSCVPPKKSSTFDWSASVTSCETGAADGMAGQRGIGADGYEYRVVGGNAAFPAPTAGESPFLGAFERAQSNDPAVVPGLLGAVTLLHPQLAGSWFDATVSIEHYAANRIEPEHRMAERTVGRATSRGTFDVESITGAAPSVPAATRWTFDGTTLAESHRGAENGNLWPVHHRGFETVFRLQTLAVAPIFAWVHDPFEVPAFPGVVYEEVEAPDGRRTTCRRMRSTGTGTVVDHEYEIDRAAPAPHPIELRLFDSMGRVRWRTTFGDYRTLVPGLWRPFRVVTTHYLDGTEVGRRVVVALQVDKAERLLPAQAASVPGSWPEDRLWFVWQ